MNCSQEEFHSLLLEAKELSLVLAKKFPQGTQATYVALLAAASLSEASGCDRERSKQSFSDALALFERMMNKRKESVQ